MSLQSVSAEFAEAVKGIDLSADSEIRRHRARCAICNSPYQREIEQMILDGEKFDNIRKWILEHEGKNIEIKTYYSHKQWMPVFVAERLVSLKDGVFLHLIEQQIAGMIAHMDQQRAKVASTMWEETIPALLDQLVIAARECRSVKQLSEALDIVVKSAQLVSGEVTERREVRVQDGTGGSGNLSSPFKDPGAKLEALRKLNPALDAILVEGGTSEVGSS